jgi:nicotinamidase-related amidase
VVIVDLQQEFTRGISAIDPTSNACEFPHLTHRVSALLAWARSSNTRIVHIREVDDPILSVWGRWWSILNPGKTALATEGGKAAEFAREAPGEKVRCRNTRHPPVY